MLKSVTLSQKLAGVILFLSFCFKAQVPFVFSIYTLSPTNSITCSQSAVVYAAAGNYSGQVNYSWNGPFASFTGSNVSINVTGIYTVSAFAPGLISSSQTVAVNININNPVSYLNVASNVIACGGQPSAPYNAYVIGTLSNPIHHFISPYGGTGGATTYSVSFKSMALGTYTHILM